MKEKKMTKKQIINLLIDVLNGATEVDDMQIFIDYLVNERNLLEKKASSSAKTKTQIENENIKEKIVATLEKLGRPALITEIQSANTELATYSNQKMSALLTQLVSANIVKREVDKKKAYFTLV